MFTRQVTGQKAGIQSDAEACFLNTRSPLHHTRYRFVQVILVWSIFTFWWRRNTARDYYSENADSRSGSSVHLSCGTAAFKYCLLPPTFFLSFFLSLTKLLIKGTSTTNFKDHIIERLSLLPLASILLPYHLLPCHLPTFNAHLPPPPCSFLYTSQPWYNTPKLRISSDILSSSLLQDHHAFTTLPVHLMMISGSEQ